MNWITRIRARLSRSRGNASEGEAVVDLEREQQAARTLLQSGVTFRLRQSADGMTGDGGRAFFNTEVSSDEVWIDSSGMEHKTPKQASKAFERQLKGYRILARRPELGPDGEQVGETVLAVKPLAEGTYRAMIASLRPTYTASASSGSLRHLLAYKRGEWLGDPR